MGFLDRFFGREKKSVIADTSILGNRSPTDPMNELQTKTVGGKLIIDGTTPEIVGELTIETKKYLINNFELEFRQNVNKINIPESETFGGFMTVSLLDKSDDLIEAWVTCTYKKHDGEVRFYENNIQAIGSSLVNIKFTEAYCMQYKREMNVLKKHDSITLQLCPQTVQLDKMVFCSKRKQ
jgi:hypothetical protein